MSAQQEDAGQDYIVEYRAGQFQNGSLVLRFRQQPSEREIRQALVDFGLPAGALEEVRARPMSGIRIWSEATRASARGSGSRDGRSAAAVGAGSAARSTPQTTVQGEEKKGGCTASIMVIVLIYFVVVGLFAQPAISYGEGMGAFLPESANPAVECFRSIEGFTYGQDEGLLEQLFSTEPTEFPVTPANAAYYLSCLTTAWG